MQNSLVFGLLSLFLASCGGGTGGDKKSSDDQAAVTVQQTTACTDPAAPCAKTVTTTVTAGGIPDSYTFLDTPDANLCLDAFNRDGITMPSNTVARTFDSRNLRANGVAITDMGDTTATPVMNVLHLSSTYSNVVFQFLNPVGFYCIVYDDAKCSNVQIQMRCSAYMTEIEPITHNTVNSEPACGFFSRMFGHCGGGQVEGGTTNSINSSITRLPCIP